jgi:hypothetical protein
MSTHAECARWTQAHSDSTRCELAVNEHEVVPPGESTHGWLPVEARMRSSAIVVLQPAWKDTADAQRRLDEPLRFAVRARGVGAGRAMDYAQGARGRPKAPGPIGRAVVGQDPGGAHLGRGNGRGSAKGYMTSSKSVLSSSVR